MLSRKQKTLLILFGLASLPVLIDAMTIHGCNGSDVLNPLSTVLGVLLYLSPWLAALAASLWWTMQPREDGAIIAGGGMTAFLFSWLSLIANAGHTFATCMN